MPAKIANGYVEFGGPMVLIGRRCDRYAERPREPVSCPPTLQFGALFRRTARPVGNLDPIYSQTKDTGNWCISMRRARGVKRKIGKCAKVEIGRIGWTGRRHQSASHREMRTHMLSDDGFQSFRWRRVSKSGCPLKCMKFETRPGLFVVAAGGRRGVAWNSRRPSVGRRRRGKADLRPGQ